jgi:hypothetical protein
VINVGCYNDEASSGGTGEQVHLSKAAVLRKPMRKPLSQTKGSRGIAARDVAAWGNRKEQR